MIRLKKYTIAAIAIVIMSILFFAGVSYLEHNWDAWPFKEKKKVINAIVAPPKMVRPHLGSTHPVYKDIEMTQEYRILHSDKQAEDSYAEVDRRIAALKTKPVAKRIVTPKKMTQSNETSLPIIGNIAFLSWKNWLISIALSAVVYTLKKVIDLLFEFIKKRLFPNTPA